MNLINVRNLNFKCPKILNNQVQSNINPKWNVFFFTILNQKALKISFELFLNEIESKIQLKYTESVVAFLYARRTILGKNMKIQYLKLHRFSL